MFLKTDYESLAVSFETSEEILYAIEIVTNEIFIETGNGRVEENPAFELWKEGGREDEILAALPTENGGSSIPEGKEIFWGMEGKFAEFAGDTWRTDEEN